jgi:hypothetical protein
MTPGERAFRLEMDLLVEALRKKGFSAEIDEYFLTHPTFDALPTDAVLAGSREFLRAMAKTPEGEGST